MPFLSRIAAALGGWFRPHGLDAEVSEELRFHLERQIEANVAAGMTPDEARRAAHLTIGSIEAVREQSRAGRPGALVHQIARDLAFGLRLLGRAPGFALVSALVVALGIGTTTAIFSIVYGVMLRPLPYADADRLVALWTELPNAPQRARMNPADYRDVRDSSTVFDDIALANAPQNFNLLGWGEPERLVAARLSSNLLSVLGMSPALGRGFTPSEEQSGRDHVVLLSDGLWRRRFAADASIVGRTIDLSGIRYEVVGVMGPGFQFPAPEHQLWIPLTINPKVLTREIATHDHIAVARLEPGIALEQARRELEAIAARLASAYPTTNRGVRLDAAPLMEEAVRPVRPVLYALGAAVSCLLLIACLNLATLFGTRAASRTREFTVRLALGASRGRLTLQALAEIAPVLVIGGIAGVAGAKWAIAMFVPIAPVGLPRVDGIGVNAPVLLFSLVIVALTGVVAGVLPAMQAWRATIPTAVIGSRSGTATRGHVRTRSVLVVAQFALTLPLLVGATGLARSFSLLMNVDPGFRAENVVSLHMAIPRAKYPTDGQIAAFYQRIVDRVAAVPGVIVAGMVNRLPLGGNDQRLAIAFEGVAGEPVSLQTRSVTPDYFRAMGIAVREGRTFSEADRAQAPLVSVVDERVARATWPGQSAIGKRFRVTLPGQLATWGEVVGVIGSIHHNGLDREDDRAIYFSYRQFTDGRVALVVRSGTDVRAMTPAILHAIRSLDPEQPVYDVRTMDDVLARSVAQRWLNMATIGVFGVSSLLLAGIGLYGVIAYGVTQRFREFGVRMALGAAPAEVSWLILRNASMLAACGALLGLGAAIALARAMRGLVYGVPPLDLVSVIAAAALLFGVALAAGYVPARRAASVCPTEALRLE